MKKQPMATLWGNNQNYGLRHRVLKVGEEMFPVEFLFDLGEVACLEKKHSGLHMTPAGVIRPIIQLFSINIQTLWVLPITILSCAVNIPERSTG
jgi:hypothetical protein